ncbi:protein kinase [bacterium]|nr:protein kinase [bacterium]
MSDTQACTTVQPRSERARPPTRPLPERGSAARRAPEIFYVVGHGRGVAPCIAGWNVEVVRPEEPSLEAIVDRLPALIVVDIAEADDGCLRFARQVQRSIGSLIPIVALVSGDGEELFERAYASGACDVLSSPVTPSLLQVKIARHARRVPRLPERVAGFRVLGVLGHGANGIVYLAERDGARVALKVLTGSALEPEALVRFRREAEALRSIRCENVPRFVAAGRDGDVFYCAMELAEGEPLSSILARGPLEEKTAARTMDQVAAALQAIHAAGLVHRDVKPGNVMVAPDGRAMLVDFGLAKCTTDPAVTRDDEILGTAAYLAPELFTDAVATPAADAFALGMTALEARLGDLPGNGSSFEIASRRARGEVPRVAELVKGACASFLSAVEGLLVADPRQRLGLEAARGGFARCVSRAC